MDFISPNSTLGQKLMNTDQTDYFFMGQYIWNRKTYLATIHILSCITIMVYCPDDGLSFGAHIYLGSLLYTSTNKLIFPELRTELLQLKNKAAIVYLIGGFQKCDRIPALAMYFQGHAQKLLFSWHIRELIRECMPLAVIDDTLLLKFPGRICTSINEEKKCCEEGHRFEVVALDTTTGKLTYQNGNYTNLECVPDSIKYAESTHMSSLTPMGAPLTPAI